MPRSHHPCAQCCPLAASTHSLARGIWVLQPTGITPTKPSFSGSIATVCPGKAMPGAVPIWSAMALDSPVLSLASLWGDCGGAGCAIPPSPCVDTALAPWERAALLHASRTCTTSFPRGTQLCQAWRMRLLVTLGWVSSRREARRGAKEAHGDGESALGQRCPKLRSICVQGCTGGARRQGREQGSPAPTSPNWDNPPSLHHLSQPSSTHAASPAPALHSPHTSPLQWYPRDLWV